MFTLNSLHPTPCYSCTLLASTSARHCVACTEQAPPSLLLLKHQGACVEMHATSELCNGRVISAQLSSLVSVSPACQSPGRNSWSLFTRRWILKLDYLSASHVFTDGELNTCYCVMHVDSQLPLDYLLTSCYTPPENLFLFLIFKTISLFLLFLPEYCFFFFYIYTGCRSTERNY